MAPLTVLKGFSGVGLRLRMIPGKPVACNLGLLPSDVWHLLGVVARCCRLRGFAGEPEEM